MVYNTSNMLPVSAGFTDGNFAELVTNIGKGQLVSTDYTSEEKPSFWDAVGDFFKTVFSLGWYSPKDLKIENVFSKVETDVANSLHNEAVRLLKIKNEEMLSDDVLQIKKRIDAKIAFLEDPANTDQLDDLIDLKNGTITMNGEEVRIEMHPAWDPEAVSKEAKHKALQDLVKQWQQNSQ